MKKLLLSIAITAAIACVGVQVQAAVIDETNIETQTVNADTDQLPSDIQVITVDDINAQSQVDGINTNQYSDIQSAAQTQAANMDAVQLKLDNVYQFQDDGWSCGIHSAYRVLKGGYNQSVDYYNQMRDAIGYFPPFRVVLIHNIVEFDLSFNSVKVGQLTSSLVNSLRGYRNSASVQSSTSNERIKDLLWEGKPVMTLVQIGSGGGSTYEGCIGVWVSGQCIGQYYFINTYWPFLHWYVAVGYDNSYIYLKDTKNNGTIPAIPGLCIQADFKRIN